MPFKDPIKAKAYAKDYHQKNKNKINARTRKWKKQHFEQWVFVNREWRQKNREQQRKYFRQYFRKLRNECLIHYGGDPPKCACCGECNIEFLTIDHINGGGNQHRRQLGSRLGIGSHFYIWLKKSDFPEGFQVLCYNCNCGRAKNHGICPHKMNTVFLQQSLYRTNA